MINPQEWLEFGQKFHGHKCPAMPNGLRAAAAAMNALGVERTGDSDILAIMELGDDHCATCFADGVQVITGCTLGKGNIQKTGRGKWGLTLVDTRTKKAVRVSPKAAMMMATKETPFFKDYREKGVAPTKVPDEVVQPLVEKVMSAPDDMLFDISEVYDYKLPEKPHSFNSFVCADCGEMTVERYGRIKDGKLVCMECAGE